MLSSSHIVNVNELQPLQHKNIRSDSFTCSVHITFLVPEMWIFTITFQGLASLTPVMEEVSTVCSSPAVLLSPPCSSKSQKKTFFWSSLLQWSVLCMCVTSFRLCLQPLCLPVDLPSPLYSSEELSRLVDVRGFVITLFSVSDVIGSTLLVGQHWGLMLFWLQLYRSLLLH